MNSGDQVFIRFNPHRHDAQGIVRVAPQTIEPVLRRHRKTVALVRTLCEPSGDVTRISQW